jgi:DNA mismatch repair protein MutS2
MEAELLYVVAKVLVEASANQQLLEAAAEEKEGFAALAELVSSPDWISEDILSAIESDGSILDSASPELARMRAESRRSRDRINSELKKYFQQGDYPDYVQDEYITIRNDRAVIPVKVEKKNTYKGIIHDRSRSGDSVYFEPMEVS